MAYFIIKEIKNFAILLIVAIATIYSIYYLLWCQLEWFLTFGWNGRWGGVIYYYMYPWPYILGVSSIFSLIGSFWISKFGKSQGKVCHRSMLIGLLIVVLISGVYCGLIWQIHDMRTAYIPEYNAVQNRLLLGVINGLADALIVYITAFPLNIIGTFVAYHALNFLAKRS